VVGRDGAGHAGARKLEEVALGLENATGEDWVHEARALTEVEFLYVEDGDGMRIVDRGGVSWRRERE